MRCEVCFGLVIAGLMVSVAQAHVTVSPRQSTLRAYERYTVRMPNERNVATVALEAEAPADVRLVSFKDEPGWTIAPTRDAAGRVTRVRWTGTLAPERFVEFGVIAVNPKSGGSLVWRFVQTYADGTTVSWNGAPGSPTPASTVTLGPSDAAHH